MSINCAFFLRTDARISGNDQKLRRSGSESVSRTHVSTHRRLPRGHARPPGSPAGSSQLIAGRRRDRARMHRRGGTARSRWRRRVSFGRHAVAPGQDAHEAAVPSRRITAATRRNSGGAFAVGPKVLPIRPCRSRPGGHSRGCNQQHVSLDCSRGTRPLVGGWVGIRFLEHPARGDARRVAARP